MKKLFLMAAAAATIMASCSQEPLSKGGNASITVKLSAPQSATRAVDTPGVDGQAPALDASGTHYVYVFQSGSVFHREALTITASGQTQQIDGGAKRFADNAQVYILANIPSDVTAPAAGATISDFEAAVSAISYATGSELNTDYTKPAMGNATGAPVTVGTPDSNNVAIAAVEISPLYTRVEFQGIQGGEWIKSFDVAGVYIDDYYSSFSMTGEGAGTINAQGQNTTFASDWFGDVPASTLTWSAGNPTLVPDAGKVWAYHVGAGSLVRFIIELDQVVVYNADGSGDPDTLGAAQAPVDNKFITVSGYAESVTAFQRGRIYSVKPITFDDPQQMSDVPNDNMVAITAEVTILNWAREEITPNF